MLKEHPLIMSLTWGIVLLETLLDAVMPLFIGVEIDGLLLRNYFYLYLTIGVFLLLILISVLRRIYDTRAYGSLKVLLGHKVNARHQNESASIRNARLNMSRELIDFLEHHLPEVIASIIQIVTSLAILYSFDANLAVAALCTLLVISAIYSVFHNSFYKLNYDLNEKLEQQVDNLSSKVRLLAFLKSLKEVEIKISDKEAYLYGLVFLCMGSLLIFNILQAASIKEVTAGSIFSTVIYTWQYIEAIILLPTTLQLYTRLQEIERRLNLPRGEDA